MQKLTSRFIAVTLLVFSVVAIAPGAQAQQQKAAPNPARITQPVDDTVLTTLRGNVHPLARAQNDLGAVPVSQPMNHVQLVLQRNSAQEAALNDYLASAQIKNSANYHKWLTPQQFGSLYGPNDADIQAITTWLTTHGLTVNKVANGRTFIDFSGSAAQIQSAFHTSIHAYQANGLRFYANANDPSIPSALAPVVSGITHLNNIPLKPQHVAAAPAKFDSQKHRFVPASSKLHGQYTANLGDGYNLVMVPADAATIYDTPNSTLNGNFTGATSYTGAGVTIGVMGQSAIDLTLVQNYRQLFVGDTKAPIVTNIDGVGDSSGDDDESYLDNELAGGLAPGATIHFYTASSTTDNGVLTAAQYAIDTDDTIDVLSMSYGSCELENTTSGNQAINSLWQQAASQGITVVVSAGDSGSTGCDGGDPTGTTTANGPLSVNGLASSPFDIAVGGTDFDALYPASGADDFSTYVNDSTAGSASTFYRTALGYIPEATWNDSTLNNTTIDDNVPTYTDPELTASLGSGSGGPSNCATNTTTDTTTGTCTAGYPKPSWQNPSTISGMPNDQVRDVPDVSFLSGTGFYGAFWAVCDGSTTNGFDANGNAGTANCVADSTGDFYTDGFGGTSAAAPTFAGIMALIVQKTGQRQGQAAPILYSLYTSMPAIFHDVDLGNNSLPCSASSYNTTSCVENNQGYDFMTGYNSNAGYDLASGLGSVDTTLLVNAWASASGSLDVANVTATPSATTISTTEPLTFTVSVASLASGGAVPAGTVSVTDGTYTLSNPVTLVSGAATITIPANSLVANAADIFTVSYAPATGSSFAPASDFAVIDVTQGVSPSLTVSGSSINVVPGGSGTSTITIAPGGGQTGAVSLTCAVTGPTGATSPPTCALSPASVTIAGTTTQTSVLTVNTTSTTAIGTYTATVTATGTGGVAGTAPISVNVTSTSTATLSVSGLPITITLPATTGSSAITVTPGGGFTGAVNLTCAVTGPTGAVSIPTCAFTTTPVTISGATAATSTLNVTAASTTSAGTYTVAVNASDAATGKVTASTNLVLTVGGTPASETITFGSPTTATVSSPGQSGTSMFSVTTDYSPATVNFSCALATSPSGANASYNPGCTVAAVTVSGAGVAATATATFTTTASSSGALRYPLPNRQDHRWYTAAGGSALACILFFSIPARRRSWRSMLSLLVFLVAITGAGCGGGSSNNNNVATGTTTGTYTFTVTGTDSVTSTITSTTTVTLTVN
jgi:subtilase family serine protease